MDWSALLRMPMTVLLVLAAVFVLITLVQLVVLRRHLHARRHLAASWRALLCLLCFALALLLDGRIHGVFSTKPTELIKAQGPLPNGKYDINDMSKGLVRLSLPGENDEWPEGESGFAARVVQHGAVAPFSRTGLRQSRDRVHPSIEMVAAPSGRLAMTISK